MRLPFHKCGPLLRRPKRSIVRPALSHYDPGKKKGEGIKNSQCEAPYGIRTRDPEIKSPML